eukprot:scaffold101_cov123-Cylindrotheca_fusiformis.AAC.12
MASTLETYHSWTLPSRTRILSSDSDENDKANEEDHDNHHHHHIDDEEDEPCQLARELLFECWKQDHSSPPSSGNLWNDDNGLGTFFVLLEYALQQGNTKSIYKSKHYVQHVCDAAERAVQEYQRRFEGTTQQCHKRNQRCISILQSEWVSAKALLGVCKWHLGADRGGETLLNELMDEIIRIACHASTKHNNTVLTGRAGALQALFFIRNEMKDPYWRIETAVELAKHILQGGAAPSPCNSGDQSVFDVLYSDDDHNHDDDNDKGDDSDDDNATPISPRSNPPSELVLSFSSNITATTGSTSARPKTGRRRPGRRVHGRHRRPHHRGEKYNRNGASMGQIGILHTLLTLSTTEWNLLEEQVPGSKGHVLSELNSLSSLSTSPPAAPAPLVQEGGGADVQHSDDVVIDWAHGVTSIALLWIRASQVFQSKEYLLRAYELCETTIWPKSSNGLLDDISLAKGQTGVAFLCLVLAEYCEKPISSLWQRRAEFLARLALSSSAAAMTSETLPTATATAIDSNINPTKNHYSLYQGLAGLASLLLQISQLGKTNKKQRQKVHIPLYSMGYPNEWLCEEDQLDRIYLEEADLPEVSDDSSSSGLSDDHLVHSTPNDDDEEITSTISLDEKVATENGPTTPLIQTPSTIPPPFSPGRAKFEKPHFEAQTRESVFWSLQTDANIGNSDAYKPALVNTTPQTPNSKPQTTPRSSRTTPSYNSPLPPVDSSRGDATKTNNDLDNATNNKSDSVSKPPSTPRASPPPTTPQSDQKTQNSSSLRPPRSVPRGQRRSPPKPTNPSSFSRSPKNIFTPRRRIQRTTQLTLPGSEGRVRLTRSAILQKEATESAATLEESDDVQSSLGNEDPSFCTPKKKKSDKMESSDVVGEAKSAYTTPKRTTPGKTLETLVGSCGKVRMTRASLLRQQQSNSTKSEVSGNVEYQAATASPPATIRTTTPSLFMGSPTAATVVSETKAMPQRTPHRSTRETLVGSSGKVRLTRASVLQLQSKRASTLPDESTTSSELAVEQKHVDPVDLSSNPLLKSHAEARLPRSVVLKPQSTPKGKNLHGVKEEQPENDSSKKPVHPVSGSTRETLIGSGAKVRMTRASLLKLQAKPPSFKSNSDMQKSPSNETRNRDNKPHLKTPSTMEHAPKSIGEVRLTQPSQALEETVKSQESKEKKTKQEGSPSAKLLSFDGPSTSVDLGEDVGNQNDDKGAVETIERKSLTSTNNEKDEMVLLNTKSGNDMGCKNENKAGQGIVERNAPKSVTPTNKDKNEMVSSTLELGNDMGNPNGKAAQRIFERHEHESFTSTNKDKVGMVSMNSEFNPNDDKVGQLIVESKEQESFTSTNKEKEEKVSPGYGLGDDMSFSIDDTVQRGIVETTEHKPLAPTSKDMGSLNFELGNSMGNPSDDVMEQRIVETSEHKSLTPLTNKDRGTDEIGSSDLELGDDMHQQIDGILKHRIVKTTEPESLTPTNKDEGAAPSLDMLDEAPHPNDDKMEERMVEAVEHESLAPTVDKDENAPLSLNLFGDMGHPDDDKVDETAASRLDLLADMPHPIVEATEHESLAPKTVDKDENLFSEMGHPIDTTEPESLTQTNADKDENAASSLDLFDNMGHSNDEKVEERIVEATQHESLAKTAVDKDENASSSLDILGDMGDPIDDIPQQIIKTTEHKTSTPTKMDKDENASSSLDLFGDMGHPNEVKVEQQIVETTETESSTPTEKDQDENAPSSLDEKVDERIVEAVEHESLAPTRVDKGENAPSSLDLIGDTGHPDVDKVDGNAASSLDLLADMPYPNDEKVEEVIVEAMEPESLTQTNVDNHVNAASSLDLCDNMGHPNDEKVEERIVEASEHESLAKTTMDKDESFPSSLDLFGDMGHPDVDHVDKNAASSLDLIADIPHLNDEKVEELIVEATEPEPPTQTNVDKDENATSSPNDEKVEERIVEASQHESLAKTTLDKDEITPSSLDLSGDIGDPIVETTEPESSTPTNKDEVAHPNDENGEEPIVVATEFESLALTNMDKDKNAASSLDLLDEVPHPNDDKVEELIVEAIEHESLALTNVDKDEHTASNVDFLDDFGHQNDDKGGEVESSNHDPLAPANEDNDKDPASSFDLLGDMGRPNDDKVDELAVEAIEHESLAATNHDEDSPSSFSLFDGMGLQDDDKVGKGMVEAAKNESLASMKTYKDEESQSILDLGDYMEYPNDKEEKSRIVETVKKESFTPQNKHKEEKVVDYKDHSREDSQIPLESSKTQNSIKVPTSIEGRASAWAELLSAGRGQAGPAAENQNRNNNITVDVVAQPRKLEEPKEVSPPQEREIQDRNNTSVGVVGPSPPLKEPKEVGPPPVRLPSMSGWYHSIGRD